MREQLPILEEEELTKKELEAKLSHKYKNFALAYIKNGGNGTHAAREAGYSFRDAGRTASRILTKNDYVVRYIALLEAQTTDKAVETITLSKEYVAEKLKKILEAGSASNEASASAGVSAATQLCKMLGYEAPTKNLNVNANLESLDQVASVVNEFEMEY